MEKVPHLIDYHVHERHSSDARRTRVRDIVSSAERNGVDEVAFTTHLVTAGPSEGFGIKPKEIDEYFEEIYSAREETRVSLRVGLEVDYFPKEERNLGRILTEHPFDFILGSVHCVNGREVATPAGAVDFYAGRPLGSAVKEYFEVWRQAIESGLFDVMAHPDYFKRYLGLTWAAPLTWSDMEEVAESPIQSLADYGVGFEVNTSCLRHGAGEFFPVTGFVQSAYQHGVRTVTVGSDSHIADTLGYRISDALGCLLGAGYSRVGSFNNRKEYAIDISSLVGRHKFHESSILSLGSSSVPISTPCVA